MKNRTLRACHFVPALSIVAAVAHQLVLANEFNPVVISATRVEQPLSEVLSSVSVISRDEIERSQAPSLADLLQGEAGFEFGRTGGPGATASFFLRGQNSTNLVILVDGVRSQVDAYGNLQLTDIPLQQIEKVEILRGNASALYGDAAIGGVINVFTRKSRIPSAYGQVSVGSNNTTQVNAGYSGGKDALRYDFSLGENRSNGFSALDPALNPRVNPDKDGYRTRYFSGKIENRIGADLTVGLRLNANDSWIDSDSGNAPDAFYGVTGDVATDVQKLRRQREAAAVFARYSVNEQWSGTVDLSHSKLKFQDYKNGIRIGSGVGEYYENGLIEGTQDTIQWDNSYRWSNATRIQVGVTTGVEKFDGSGNSPYSLQRDNVGYYAGLTHMLDRWTFQVNARRDEATLIYQDQYSNGLGKLAANTGLAGLAYKLNEQWRVTATTSTGFKLPGAAEIASNAALRPESHKSYEAGLTYSDERSLLRAVYFDTQTHDAIVYASTPPYALSNIGEVRNKGIETTARGKLYGFILKGTLVIQDPWNVSENKQLARRAKEYGQIDVSRVVNDYNLGARVYSSGPRTDGATANTLAGYGLLSLYASKVLTDQWTARIRVDNALDKRYQLAYGFNTPGRTLMLTLQYSPKQ
jgi:vitamin B12 transporter